MKAAPRKPKAVVIYSGGMDSFTLLHDVSVTHDVKALSFNYGQKHKKELLVAQGVCLKGGIDHRIIDLTSITQLLKGSSLTDSVSVPEGGYSEPSMKSTVVPNRNCIMLSIAMAWAVSLDCESVFCAVHSGDHAIYPDCRREFIDAMTAVGRVANYKQVYVCAPYLMLDKAGILARGRYLGLTSDHYAYTWTCYNGRDLACGRCGSCVERLEAFDKVGWDDPLCYQDRFFWAEATGRTKAPAKPPSGGVAGKIVANAKR